MKSCLAVLKYFQSAVISFSVINSSLLYLAARLYKPTLITVPNVLSSQSFLSCHALELRHFLTLGSCYGAKRRSELFSKWIQGISWGKHWLQAVSSKTEILTLKVGHRYSSDSNVEDIDSGSGLLINEPTVALSGLYMILLIFALLCICVKRNFLVKPLPRFMIHFIPTLDSNCAVRISIIDRTLKRVLVLMT